MRSALRIRALATTLGLLMSLGSGCAEPSPDRCVGLREQHERARGALDEALADESSDSAGRRRRVRRAYAELTDVRAAIDRLDARSDDERVRSCAAAARVEARVEVALQRRVADAIVYRALPSAGIATGVLGGFVVYGGFFMCLLVARARGREDSADT